MTSVTEVEKNGLRAIQVSNRRANALIYVMGAHVGEYQKVGDEYPVLWMSSCSRFRSGDPIRGGMPDGFPNFGQPPSGSSLPLHGFVRTFEWQYDGAEEMIDGDTKLFFHCENNEQTMKVFPRAFRRERVVVVGNRLSVSAKTTNTGEEAITYQEVFHSYLDVGDSMETSISGLHRATYFDKVGDRYKIQEGVVRLVGEVDRVYRHCGKVVVTDSQRKRHINVCKWGSGSTVVWNPGPDKAARMTDFGNDEWRAMVCVEAGNCRRKIRLPPGKSHTLTQLIWPEIIY